MGSSPDPTVEPLEASDELLGGSTSDSIEWLLSLTGAPAGTNTASANNSPSLAPLAAGAHNRTSSLAVGGSDGSAITRSISMSALPSGNSRHSRDAIAPLTLTSSVATSSALSTAASASLSPAATPIVLPSVAAAQSPPRATADRGSQRVRNRFGMQPSPGNRPVTPKGGRSSDPAPASVSTASGGSGSNAGTAGGGGSSGGGGMLSLPPRPRGAAAADSRLSSLLAGDADDSTSLQLLQSTASGEEVRRLRQEVLELRVALEASELRSGSSTSGGGGRAGASSDDGGRALPPLAKIKAMGVEVRAVDVCWGTVMCGCLPSVNPRVVAPCLRCFA